MDTTFGELFERWYATAAPRWVVKTTEVRLIDLRDGELGRLGLERAQLVSTTAAHYPCTRAWARALHDRSVGGHKTHGIVWHSRQTELHARAMAGRRALQELIDTHHAEVAVVWAPPAPAGLLASNQGSLGHLDVGDGLHYVVDSVALLGIVSQ